MELDVRYPMGLLFLILGGILLVHGFTSDAAIYAKSLGQNVNVLWGGIFAAFGAVMFFLSRKKI
ncbi:MAG: hypothetical protein SFV32_02270 [Opitutaceae bacterium]|nr:hypothetical protein [Opitutaceae bacterium]